MSQSPPPLRQSSGSAVPLAYATPSQFDPSLGHRPPFASASGRGTITIGLLLANAALSVVSIVSSFMQVSLLNAANAGAMPTADEIDANDTREAVIGLCSFGVYVLTVIFFCVWMYRSYRNVAALGGHTERSAGWAVGSWFVPFANLVVPYRAIRDMVVALPAGPAAGLVGVYWATWLISNFIGNASLRLSLRAETIDQFILSTYLGIASEAASIPAALLAAWIVRSVTAGQDEQAGTGAARMVHAYR